MRKQILFFVGVMLIGGAGVLQAGDFVNPGFEIEFGSLEEQNVWGDFGESFGEAYQVYAGKENGPDKAHGGSRALLINVPQNSWDGVWQQLPWEENTPFSWSAYYLIKGGNLPVGTATFMKLEFMDGLDRKIDEVAGEQHAQDTGGQWLKDTMTGVTPEGTRSIRFILIGGHSSEEESMLNRIYWDDSDTDD